MTRKNISKWLVAAFQVNLGELLCVKLFLSSWRWYLPFPARRPHLPLEKSTTQSEYLEQNIGSAELKTITISRLG